MLVHVVARWSGGRANDSYYWEATVQNGPHKGHRVTFFGDRTYMNEWTRSDATFLRDRLCELPSPPARDSIKVRIL